MRLTGLVVGGIVRFFKGVYPKSALDAPRKDVLFFGLEHKPAQEYMMLNRSEYQVGNTYVPRWLEALAKTADTTSRTAILLEMPPVDPPEILNLTTLDAPGQLTSDMILFHCFKLLRPLFADGVAAANGWILEGTDLRYKFRYEENKLVKGERDYRHYVLHKDIEDHEGTLGEWDPNPMLVKNYYRYLTGESDDLQHLEHFVEALVLAAKNIGAETKRLVLAAGAEVCRSLYASVPQDVRNVVIDFFAGKIAHRGPSTVSVIKYGVGEVLVNVALVGYMLSTAVDVKNVVVVIGDAHVDMVGELLHHISSRTAIGVEVDLLTGSKIVQGSSAVRSSVFGAVDLT